MATPGSGTGPQQRRGRVTSRDSRPDVMLEGARPEPSVEYRTGNSVATRWAYSSSCQSNGRDSAAIWRTSRGSTSGSAPVRSSGEPLNSVAAWRAASMNSRSLRGSLRPGRDLHPARHVDAPRPHQPDRLADVVRREPARQHHAHTAGHALGQPPVEHPARTGIGRVDEDHVGGAVGRGPQRGIPRRERLDHEPHALPHPLHLRTRLHAVELRRVQAGTRHDVDDVRGPVVAEHADRDHLARGPASRCRERSRRSPAGGSARTRSRARRRRARRRAARRLRW